MVALGFLVGLGFSPLGMIYFNDSFSIPFSFALMYIGATITVGIANYIIVALVVCTELRFQVDAMENVNRQISSALFRRNLKKERYKIKVRSDGMLEQATHAFNIMGKPFEKRLEREASFRDVFSTFSAVVDLDAIAEDPALFC